VDPAAIVGVLLGFVAVFGTQILEGGSPTSILLVPPLFLIFVGSAGASLASNTFPGMMAGIKWLVYAMTAKKSDPETVVEPPSVRGVRACWPWSRRWRRSTTPS
jgi:chemotaxis protein MotA